MREAEFDQFADSYFDQLACNISASGETPEFFAAYKVADMKRDLLRTNRFSPDLKIMDFGAGIGNSIAPLQREFGDAELYFVDPSERSLRVAERRHPGAGEFIPYDGRRLPFADARLDVAFASCVFHHIDHAQHISLLREIRRTLKPGGYLFLFEHNPFNPLTRKAVDSCPFDDNAVLISARKMKSYVGAAAYSEIRTFYRIFFPRALAFLRPLERALTGLPLGAQYYIRAISR